MLCRQHIARAVYCVSSMLLGHYIVGAENFQPLHYMLHLDLNIALNSREEKIAKR